MNENLTLDRTDLRSPEIAGSGSGDLSPIPLSSGQQRLWFLDRMQRDSPLYNIPYLIRIGGQLDVNALERAIEMIVERHESLRTTIGQVAGETSQIIHPPSRYHLPITDLTLVAENEREEKLHSLAREVAVRPFDLSVDLMLRAHLYCLGDEQHALVLVMHHIASDGWSASVLFRELGAFYQTRSRKQSSPLPELPIQFADFAEWQNTRLSGENLGRLLSFWKERLAGAPSLLELNPDHSRPAVQTYRGDLLSVQIPPGLLAALNEFNRRHGTTLFMTLFSAFNVLLHRYTGQTDLVVGSPVAGRERAELEGLIGFFANTLVLRSDLSGDPTFAELLDGVRTVVLRACEHQEIPFEKLVEELQVERNLSYSPLCQVVFAMQNMPSALLELSGLTTAVKLLHTGTAKFDLTVTATETADGLDMGIEFNTELFERYTIQRLLGHFRVLLEAIVTDPDQRISRLPLIGKDESRQLFVEWNDTGVDYPEDALVHRLFEQQVERTPAAVALVFEEQQITYRELNERADVVASKLRSLGVGPDVRVGICVKRSLEMMVGLLGILKAGGCYVPLDPTYPRERLAFMLEDSGAKVLISQDRFSKVLKSQIPGLNVVSLDQSRNHENGTDARHQPGSKSSDLAYVIYTSGSTGKPKGVMISHQNVVNFFTAMDQVLGTKPGVWLAVTSISFDISVLELFWTLARGFKVVIHEHDRTAGNAGETTNDRGRSIPEQIVRHGISHLQCTPSLAKTLVLTPASVDALRRLDKLLLGGEAMPVSLARQLRPIVPTLLNMYGPTETTIWSTCQAVNEVGKSVYIGRPLANTRVYILDRNLEPVPAGVPGEICIGGAGVARGYLNRPDLTAEKFIRDSFCEKSGSKIYRTGDLGRWRSDGTLEFLGRLDFQVKIRGHRIELNEIEEALGRHPGVREAVVVTREDSPGDKRLVAYLVADSGEQPSASNLRQFAQQNLPEAMVPSTFAFLDALPLTPNGKVDRKALPRIETVRPKLDSSYVAPHDGVEKAIAGIWREVLQVSEVGLHDNFFDLGGHSLLLMQVQARLSAMLGHEVPVVKLFQYPTIGALAGFLGNGRADSVAPSGDRGLRKQAVMNGRFKRDRIMIA